MGWGRGAPGGVLAAWGQELWAAATGSKFPPQLSGGACLSPPLCAEVQTRRRSAQPSVAARSRPVRPLGSTRIRAVRTRRPLHVGLQCPAGPKLLLAVSGAWCRAWPPCRGGSAAKVSWGAGGWRVRLRVLLRPGQGVWNPGLAVRLAPGCEPRAGGEAEAGKER